MAEDLTTARMDKSSFVITTHAQQQASDRAYWVSRSFTERMENLELLRRIHYGYDPATTRLQRIFTILESLD